MKYLTTLIFAALALLCLQACTTTTGTNPDRSAAITSAVLELAGTAIAPVLTNNPEYRPVASGVAEALGTLETGTITAETVRSFIAALAERQGWAPDQRAYAELMAASAWTIYTAQTGQTSAPVSDPQTLAWISAFRRGLQTAVALSAAPASS